MRTLASIKEKEIPYSSYQKTDSVYESTKDTDTYKCDGYFFVSESRLNQMIAERVDESIEKILKQRQTIELRKIKDLEAKRQISDFIRKKQQKGIFKLGILDIVLGLKLPPEQTEKIMDSFVKTGKINKI